MPNEIPVTIGRSASEQPNQAMPIDTVGEQLGFATAAMLRHLVAVLDREDRLESGTGDFLATFRTDDGARRAAVQEGVLRSLRMAADATNHQILTQLTSGQSLAELSTATGLAPLSVAERISDLVSAGLASKLADANRMVITEAGQAVVTLVEEGVEAGARDLAGR